MQFGVTIPNNWGVEDPKEVLAMGPLAEDLSYDSLWVMDHLFNTGYIREYNREMKQLMLQHAFRFVNCVVFLVGLQNLRSQRAVEKIGGVRVGSRPDGGGRNSHVYQITASTFAPP